MQAVARSVAPVENPTYGLFGPLNLLPALVLSATLSPFLYAFIDVALGALPLSYIMVSAILYYIDARLRLGVDVASNFYAAIDSRTHASIMPLD